VAAVTAVSWLSSATFPPPQAKITAAAAVPSTPSVRYGSTPPRAARASRDNPRAATGAATRAATGAATRAGSGAATEADPCGARLRRDPGATPSDDRLTVERVSYRQLRLHALEHLSRLFRVRGEHASALTAALAAVQADQLRESAHRQVISVHLAESNPAEALRQFRVYRRLLGHELGPPPSPAIRALVAPLLGRPMENPRRHRS
jgi:DNA-binding SARP family transcriptional activator